MYKFEHIQRADYMDLPDDLALSLQRIKNRAPTQYGYDLEFKREAIDEIYNTIAGIANQTRISFVYDGRGENLYLKFRLADYFRMDFQRGHFMQLGLHLKPQTKDVITPEYAGHTEKKALFVKKTLENRGIKIKATDSNQALDFKSEILVFRSPEVIIADLHEMIRIALDH
ncbi:hypothetical protein GF376_02975 [Candidatus Peregrinibacteria bacterium]|nr:hypothetical protein [Candidatus Peregrinibacteria bacterium]